MISLVAINRNIFSKKDIQSWCSRYRIQRIIVFSNTINTNAVTKMSLKLHKPSEVKLNLIDYSHSEYFLKRINFIDENLMLIFDDVILMSEIIKEMDYKGKIVINDFLLTNKKINPEYNKKEVINSIKLLLKDHSIIYKKNVYSPSLDMGIYLSGR